MANQLAMDLAAGSSSPASPVENKSGGPSSASNNCEGDNNACAEVDKATATQLSTSSSEERVAAGSGQRRHLLSMNEESIGEASVCTSNEMLQRSSTVDEQKDGTDSASGATAATAVAAATAAAPVTAATAAAAAAVASALVNKNIGGTSGDVDRSSDDSCNLYGDPGDHSNMNARETGKESGLLETVKSSAMMTERRTNTCLLHRMSASRKPKVDVACQTDPDEETFPKISQCLRNSNVQLSNNKNSASSSTDASSATSSTSSDGTLRLMIQNFKNMADTVRGPSKKIQSVPWRIMVMPRQHVVQKKGTQKCLGFFLQCCPDAYSDSWSCQAAAELRLISQKQGVPHFTRKTNHVYTAKENDWGYSCFMTWADILDETQGYIKDDKVILEVSVKAESPKNILTHEQFEKKIQDYIRLADIQSSRGLIDKAIEVNLSALKFCKDRDQDCKAELESQKARLIEMKLKQSIERIEKGPPVGKNEEEGSLNQNALKQAISGAPNINKQPSVSKSTLKNNTSGKMRDSNSDKNSITAMSPTEKATETKPIMEFTASENQNDQKAALQKQFWPLTASKVDDETKEKGDIEVDSNVIEAKADIDERMNSAPGRFNRSQLQMKDDLQNEMEADLSVLSKMAKDDDYQEDEMKIPSLNERCKEIIRKHHELESENQLAAESDDDSSSSSDLTSDSDLNDNHIPKNVTLSVSKKSKRLRNMLTSSNAGDCDTCIQAMMVANLPATEEAYSQTDFSMLTDRGPKINSPVLGPHAGLTNVNTNRHYAQPKKQTARKSLRNGADNKLEDVDWRKKKFNDLKEVDSTAKDATLNDGAGNRGDSVPDYAKEGIARFTAQFPNPDPKSFPILPLYHPAPQQFFGEELSNSQIPHYLDDAAQQNIWSRQYIEEWLKFNIKYCWNYMRNGENSGDEAAMDFAAANFPHFSDAQLQQVMAALSVIDVNCMNAKRVVDKAAEFMNAIELRSKSPFLKGCLQKLAILAGDDKANDAIRESRKDIDTVSIDENALATPITDETEDITNMMPDCPDEPQDYELKNELHRIGFFTDKATCKKPLIEVAQIEKLSEHTEKIAQRIVMLENDKETLSKQVTSEKERNKKLDQKHVNTVKQLQSQLQAEKDKHEKVMQQLNQKKNEMKKQEKILKQHERDAEKLRELQEKNDTLVREAQEMRQKNAEELRKLQRELQSSQDTRKNMSEEIKGRESEICELKSQLNEKSLALKRSENALCSERKTFQSNISSVTDRAKKAEILYLEHKLETGIAILERAHKDAGQRVKDLESDLKKVRSGVPAEEIKGLILEWKAKREEVMALITSSKAEFAAQASFILVFIEYIELIKSGKPLSQLPRISVPKPPPAPKSKIVPYVNQISLEKPVVGVNAPSVGVIGNNRTITTQTAGATIGSSVPPISMAPGSPLLTLSKAPAPPTASSIKSPTTSTTVTLMGAKPINSSITTPLEFGGTGGVTSVHSTQASSIKSVPQPSTCSSGTSGIPLSTGWGGPWETPLPMNSLNELMNPSRSFGPIGSDYGIGSGNSSNQLSHPHLGLANASSHYASSQSNGWSNGMTNEWSTALSQYAEKSTANSGLTTSQPSSFNPLHQSSGYQSQQWSGWHGYHAHQAGGANDVAGGLIESGRCSSPRRDAVLDALKNHFPLVPIDNLKDYLNDFMLRNSTVNLKSLPMNELVNFVACAVGKAQQMWSKGGGMPAMMHQPPPNVMNTVNVGLTGVDPYQTPSRIQSVHSHPIMQQQLRDGMES